MAKNPFVLSICQATTTANKTNCSQAARYVLILALMICTLFCAPSALGEFLINSPSSQWTSLLFGTNSLTEPANDQQTGSAELDIVGNQSYPSLFMQYDNGGSSSMTNGWLGFRFRVGADVNPIGYKGDAFIGVDANLDGKLDLFIGVDNSGSANRIGIWYPGTTLGISPSTTTIANSPTYSYAETTLNYSFAPVTSIDPSATSIDLNGDGQTDQFLSFEVPFSDVVAALEANGISIDSSSQMQVVAYTATQANSLNGDLNGAIGGNNSDLSWSQLGAMSETYLFNGDLASVPEPSALSFLLAGGVVLICFQQQRIRP